MRSVLPRRRRRMAPAEAPIRPAAVLPPARSIASVVPPLRRGGAVAALRFLHEADRIAAATLPPDPGALRLAAELSAIQVLADVAPVLMDNPAVRMALAPLAELLAGVA